MHQRNTIFPGVKMSKKFPQRKGWLNATDDGLNNIPSVKPHASST